MLTSETETYFDHLDRLGLVGGRMVDAELSSGVVRGDDGLVVGEYQGEHKPGIECCQLETIDGDLVEVVVTDKAMVVGLNDATKAVYSRADGSLLSASFSLVEAILLSDGLDLLPEVIDETMRQKSLGVDFVVVMILDQDDCEVSLVKTVAGSVFPMGRWRRDEMTEGYGDGGDDEMVADFSNEGEEEVVGDLLSAVLARIPYLEVGFGVGVREGTVDLCIINPDEEASIYHARRNVDVRPSFDRRLDGDLALSLAREAFPFFPVGFISPEDDEGDGELV